MTLDVFEVVPLGIPYQNHSSAASS